MSNTIDRVNEMTDRTNTTGETVEQIVEAAQSVELGHPADRAASDTSASYEHAVKEDYDVSRASDTPTERWYFTFGFAHVHPVTGESLKNCYVAIDGDVNETREIMQRHFGLKWSMQYPSTEKADVQKYRLERIDLPPTEPAGDTQDAAHTLTASAGDENVEVWRTPIGSEAQDAPPEVPPDHLWVARMDMPVNRYEWKASSAEAALRISTLEPAFRYHRDDQCASTTSGLAEALRAAKAYIETSRWDVDAAQVVEDQIDAALARYEGKQQP